MTKYIVVSGGVISGVGKGVIASSTGTLLKSLGLRVTAIKIDPYLNIDAGLMSPLDHGMLVRALQNLFSSDSCCFLRLYRRSFRVGRRRRSGS